MGYCRWVAKFLKGDWFNRLLGRGSCISSTGKWGWSVPSGPREDTISMPSTYVCLLLPAAYYLSRVYLFGLSDTCIWNIIIFYWRRKNIDDKFPRYIFSTICISYFPYKRKLAETGPLPLSPPYIKKYKTTLPDRTSDLGHSGYEPKAR